MKVLIVLAALVATTLAFEKCGLKGSGSRIVNGLPAAHGEFPWQISLRYAPAFYYQKQHICGGTLIAPGWVLCAAHCFGMSKNPSKFRVRVGEWHQNNNDGTEKDVEVEKIIVHSEFKNPSKFRVRVGEWHQNNNDGTEKDVEVEKIIVHSEFNRPHQVEHDVA